MSERGRNPTGLSPRYGPFDGAGLEPLAGTAPHRPVWALVEHPGPWGREAVLDAAWDVPGERLQSAFDAAGVRVVLARRYGREGRRTGQDGGTRVILARCGPGGWAARTTVDGAAGRAVPLLVKIAPDLADADIVEVAELVVELDLAGVVATNTTIARTGLRTDVATVERIGAGGLSGPVLQERSHAVLRLLRAHLPADCVVISVGGVGSATDVLARLADGATLVQAYTAFIYEGPLWVSRVNRELAAARKGQR